MNNLTFYPLYKIGIGRADIEESKSDVAMNAWPPQASYPCGNFSVQQGITGEDFSLPEPCTATALIPNMAPSTEKFGPVIL